MKKTGGMYKNKDIFNDKKEIDRNNEILINRLMILFVLAIVAVTLLIIVMNMSVISYLDFYEKYALSGIFVFGGLFLLSLVFFFYETVKKKSNDKTLNKYNISAFFALLLAFTSLFYIKGIDIVPVLLAVTITITVLIFVYYLYQKEFFWFSAMTAAGCFIIHLATSTMFGGVVSTVAKLLLILLFTAIIVLSLRVQKDGGYFGKNKSIKFAEANTNYILVWILCGILILAGILGFIVRDIFVANIFYYIIGILAYFLGAGIYYTIKLI